MPEYTPGRAAELLGISPEALRMWARKLAPLLTDRAQGGKRARRIYQDSDITLFLYTAALLNDGMTLEQIYHNLSTSTDVSPLKTSPTQPQPYPSDTSQQAMVVLDQAPELVALRQALEQTLEAQRHTIESQRILIDQVQGERQRDNEERERLEQQLVEVQAKIERVPRILRWLWGVR